MLKLLPDEHIICRLEKNILIWLSPLFDILLFIIASGFHNNNPRGSGGLFMFIFFVVFVFDTIYRIRYWGYVTNKRIIKHSGVLLKEEELRIDQVESIVVERYKYVLWHQAFFSGSGGVTLKFDFISNHDEFKDAVYKAKENPNIVAKL